MLKAPATKKHLSKFYEIEIDSRKKPMLKYSTRPASFLFGAQLMLSDKFCTNVSVQDQHLWLIVFLVYYFFMIDAPTWADRLWFYWFSFKTRIWTFGFKADHSNRFVFGSDNVFNKTVIDDHGLRSGGVVEENVGIWFAAFLFQII